MSRFRSTFGVAGVLVLTGRACLHNYFGVGCRKIEATVGAGLVAYLLEC